MKYWAYVLSGTILEKKKVGKKDDKFLDPWTSLLPDFLEEKLSSDILLAFDDDGDLVSKNSTKLDWALIFPKRSYLPPDYPHVQLWFLGDDFNPSLNFLRKREQEGLVRLIKLMDKATSCFVQENKAYVDCQPVMAINATPFSFIKNKDGRYYSGGQSVRTFHLHYLLMPKNLKKKELTLEQAALVYPTSFALKLFTTVFLNPRIRKKLFGNNDLFFEKTDRGLAFEVDFDIKDLVAVLDKIDKLFCQLQLGLIYSFYSDSSAFLGTLNEFMVAKDLRGLKPQINDLILEGKERPLKEITQLLEKKLSELALNFNTTFSKKDIQDIGSSLVLADNHDLASFVGSKKVILRPGMGYGTLIRVLKSGFRIELNPLDSILAEGTMESSGYIFAEKIKIDKKPDWVDSLSDCFKKTKDQ